MTILKAIIDFFIGVFADILGGMVTGAGELINRPSNHGFHDELQKPEDLLSSNAKGIAIGQKQMDLETSFAGGLLGSGMPGSGKSLAVAATTVLLSDFNFIIYDPSRTLFPILGPYLKHKRKYDKVLILDFTSPDLSVGFNPLERITSTADAQTLANILLEPLTRNSKDQFWGLEGANILTLLIDLLLEQPKEYRNLFNLGLLVNEASSNREKLDRLVVKSKNQGLYSKYKAMLVGMKSENTLSSLLATIRAATSVFLNEDVAKTTSIDTLGDLSQLIRKQRIGLFIQVPTMDIDRVAPIVAVFVSQLYKTILGTIPEKQDHNVLLLLDEFSTLAPSLLRQTAIFQANSRKARATQLLLVQSCHQLSAIDKELANTLKANMNRLTFGNMGMSEAVEISATLGQYSYQDAKGIERNRVLKTPTELRNLKQWQAILQIGSKSAIVEATPYFKSWRFRNIASLPPLTLERQLPVGPIPILPLP